MLEQGREPWTVDGHGKISRNPNGWECVKGMNTGKSSDGQRESCTVWETLKVREVWEKMYFLWAVKGNFPIITLFFRHVSVHPIAQRQTQSFWCGGWCWHHFIMNSGLFTLWYTAKAGRGVSSPLDLLLFLILSHAELSIFIHRSWDLHHLTPGLLCFTPFSVLGRPIQDMGNVECPSFAVRTPEISQSSLYPVCLSSSFSIFFYSAFNSYLK
jgi:hypothetical protein